MSCPPPDEIRRQYRVAKQTLAMHHDLRESYIRTALLSEIAVITLSTLSLIATFGGTELVQLLRLDEHLVRLAFAGVALIGFVASLVILLANPRGQAARHADAAAIWWRAVDDFRRDRQADGSWTEAARTRLAGTFATACAQACEVPGSQFNRLKSRYHWKLALSRARDNYPGCPTWVLAVILIARDVAAASIGLRSHEPDREP